MGNIVRARVKIRGTRTLLQHHFGPDAIALEKQEKTGVAGNDPQEWLRTRMVNAEGRLFLPAIYVFGCLKNGAVHSKKGRGSLQSALVSTLEIEDEIILLNRVQPDESKITQQELFSPADPTIETFVHVGCVRNPATKGRNVRYRLATRAGWECEFTIRFDKTVISKEQMRAILNDSGKLGGLGDGIKVGQGRFDVVSYVELTGAEETSAEGTVGEDAGNGLEQGRPEMRPLPKTGRSARVSH